MSNTNVTYLRDWNGHPVGVLAVRSDPDSDFVLIAASICAPEDRQKFKKETGVKIALDRLDSDRAVRSTTSMFEDAVAAGDHGDALLMQVATLAIVKSGAPDDKVAKLDPELDPKALAACERYARKGKGRF